MSAGGKVVPRRDFKIGNQCDEGKQPGLDQKNAWLQQSCIYLLLIFQVIHNKTNERPNYFPQYKRNLYIIGKLSGLNILSYI